MYKLNFTPLHNQVYVMNNLSNLLEKDGLVVINDDVGTGKTVSLLLWIFHQKIQNKPYKTKVFVSKNIIFQWEEDLLKFFKDLLSYKLITNSKNEECLEQYDFIICTDNLSGLKYSNHYICFDEFTSVNHCFLKNKKIHELGETIPKLIIISSDKFINNKSIVDTIQNYYRALIYITKKTDLDKATYYYNKYLNCKTHMSLDYLIIAKSDCEIKFNKPNKLFYTYKISEISEISLKYLDPQLNKMLREDDIQSVMDILSSRLENNLFEKNKIELELNNPDYRKTNTLFLIEELINEELNVLLQERKYLEEKKSNNIDAINEVNAKINTKEVQIRELKERYDSIMSGECNICYGDLFGPVFYKCCQNVICYVCKKFLKNCPYCRNVTPDTTTLISEEELSKFEKLKTIENDLDTFLNPEQLKYNKIKTLSTSLTVTLSKILQNSKSTIIFRTRENILDVNIDKEIGILTGTAEERHAIIQKYKNGELEVLFLNMDNDYSGLRLENTTDIIFISIPNKEIEKQIIGRALRKGRKQDLQLNLHFLKCV